MQTTNPEWLAREREHDSRGSTITGSVMGVVGHCNQSCRSRDDDRVLSEEEGLGVADGREGQVGQLPLLVEITSTKTRRTSPSPKKPLQPTPPPSLTKRTRGEWTLRNFRIQELGLYVCKALGTPCSAPSPDGVLHTTWEDPDGKTVKKVELIEYKCPATWQKKMGNPGIYKHNMLPQRFPTGMRDSLGEYPPSDWLPHRRRLPLPPYYNAQVQYGMELFRRSGVTMDRCHFVVWTPQRTSVTVVDRDAAYGKWLLARGKQFWEDVYAKNVVLKATGKLNTDEVLPNGE